MTKETAQDRVALLTIKNMIEQYKARFQESQVADTPGNKKSGSNSPKTKDGESVGLDEVQQGLSA